MVQEKVQENLETLALTSFLVLPHRVNYLENFYKSLPKKQQKEYKDIFNRLLAVYHIYPIRAIIDEILLRDNALPLLVNLDKHLETLAKFSHALFTKPQKEFESLRLVNYLQTFAEKFLETQLSELLEKHIKNADFASLLSLLN